MDPSNRITCEGALQHPFHSDFHDPDDEPISKSYTNPHENDELSITEWKGNNNLYFFLYTIG